ncbi:hypothetical protein HBI33_214960 [Parastagonospora nodorum]|nr:hypothetical protein HBI33_214960 [Parastagonospora nodorum]
MKSFVAIIALATAASAASLSNPLFQRAPAAVCNGHSGESCAQPNQRACEDNGGHSLICVEKSRGKFAWINADNCPDSNQHCDCADGFCKPN